MKCLECSANNMQYETSCGTCGESLRPSLAQLYLDRALVEINKGHYEAASLSMVKADQEMLASSKEQREKHLLSARAFWLQSCIYYQKGKMEEARAELLLAERALRDNAAGKELLADTLNRLGNIAYYNGNFDEAASYYQRSSDAAIAVGAYSAAVKASANLGNISVTRSDIAGATVHYNRALEYARNSDDESLAGTYGILAWLHSHYGPFPLALEYAARVVTLCAQIDNLDARSVVLNDAASVYIKAGRYDLAERYLREVYDRAMQTGSKLAEELAMSSLAELLPHHNDSDSWLALAVKTFNDSGSSVLLRSKFALHAALYYIGQRDWVRVRRHLRQLQGRDSLEPDAEGAATINHAQGLLYAALGEWDAAATHFKQAIRKHGLALYDSGVVWQDYGAMLLRRAEVDSSPTIGVEAQAALTQSAAMFRALQLDYRLNIVEALLKRMPMLVTRNEAIVMADGA